MACGFTVTDCFGRTVTLDHANWQKHLQAGRHLEVVPYLPAFPLVLTAPDVVIEVASNSSYHYFRRGIGQGRFRQAWLCLVVATFPRGHRVVTWRFMPRIAVQGVQRWPRP